MLQLFDLSGRMKHTVPKGTDFFLMCLETALGALYWLVLCLVTKKILKDRKKIGRGLSPTIGMHRGRLKGG